MGKLKFTQKFRDEVKKGKKRKLTVNSQVITGQGGSRFIKEGGRILHQIPRLRYAYILQHSERI